MNNKELFRLALDVALELNAEIGPQEKFWLAESNGDTWVKINKPDTGAKLYLQSFQYNGDLDRIAISGSLSIGKNNTWVDVYENGTKQVVPTISVNSKRGAKVIAKEIERRLLPEYLRILVLAQNKIIAEKIYLGKGRVALLELAAIIHREESLRDLQDGQSLNVNYYTENKGNGSIEWGNDTVDLKLYSLSLEKAKQILRVLDIHKEDYNK